MENNYIMKKNKIHETSIFKALKEWIQIICASKCTFDHYKE